MTEIRFLITEQSVNNMTWEDFETLERAQEGSVKLYNIRPIVAHFLTDENNNYIEYEKAMKILGKLPASKIKETLNLFVDTIRVGTVPKGNGSLSSLPTEAPITGSPSLVGLEQS